MTLAEYIAELEERAKRHRRMAMEAEKMLPPEAPGAIMIATVTQSLYALGLEEAALLARGITEL
jgi:hypothetical protein